MLNWHDWAACCAPILDSRDQITESKSITLDATGASAVTLQPYPYALDTTDTSKMQFTSLELKDLDGTGVLTLRINYPKSKLN